MRSKNRRRNMERNLFKKMLGLAMAITLCTTLVLCGCGGNEDSYGMSQTDAGNVAQRAKAVVKADNAAASGKALRGSLQVAGSSLLDSAGNAVQLRGISTHGMAWFPQYVNQQCFKSLRDTFNINTIRLAMYTAEYGGYCSGGDQQQLKALVDTGVQAATNLNMYVIIDWHILADSNPQQNKEAAKAFFSEVSRKYAGYGNVLYEICNEPNGGTSWQDIKSYANEVIPAIRANAPDSIIIVGTPNWSQFVDQAAADPIRDQKNIMYTLHYYAATHKEDLRAKAEVAIKSGLPIFVTEFGICDASGSGGIDYDQAQKWFDFLNQNKISFVAWNLSNKGETSAILSSSCSKTADFTDADLSTSGKWLKSAYNAMSKAVLYSK